MAEPKVHAGYYYHQQADGSWKKGEPVSQMPADPTFPYQGPKAAADITKTQTDIVDTQADNARDDLKLEAELRAKGMRVVNGRIEEIPGWTPPEHLKPATVIEEENKTKGKAQKADVVRAIMRRTLDFYKQDIKGQPAGRLWGLTERFDGGEDGRDLIKSPEAERFTRTAEGMLALIRPMVAMGAKDGDSNVEMLVFKSYIPAAGDSDLTIESKLRNLEVLLDGVASGKRPSQVVEEGLTGSTPLVDGALSGRQEDRRPPPVMEQPGFASGGDGEKSIPIPQPMQDEHAAYLQQNWGRIQPEDYAAFRADLDGKYGFTPNPDAYLKVAPRLNERAMQGGKPDGLNIPPVNAAMDGQDQLNASLFNNKAGGFIFGAGDQLGVADELAGGFNSLVNGTSYDVEVARANAMKQAMQGAYPGMNLAGNVTGALATGTGLAKAFPGVTGAFTNTAKRAVATGSGFGALSGAGEMNDSRVTGGLIGGGLGLAGGAAGAAAAPLLSRAMGTQAGQAASRAGRSIWNHTGGKVMPSMAVSPAPVVPQFSKGEGLLPANVLESAIPNLQDADGLGLPYALADANPQLRALAGSVSRRSVDARQMAENIFEPRAMGQADRATDAIDQHLAPQTNIGQRKNELLDAGNAASEPFYRMAEGVRTPVDPQLQALLRSSSGQDALGRAKSIMSDRGIPDTDKRIFFGPDNLLTTENTPAFQTLDYVKKGIDARLSEAKNPITGELDLRGNPALQAVEGWRKNYIGALDAINPDYAKARATYAPYAQRAEALERGYAAPATNVRPRDLQGAINRLGPEQLPEYQRGFATKLIDDTNATRFAGNPYTRIAGSPQQMEKLGMVFPEGADKFGRVAGLEKDMAKTAYETLGGSPTAMRHATDQQFDNGMMGLGTDLAADVAGGGGAFTLKNMIGKGVRAMGDTARLKGGKSKADAIAPVLFAPDPRMTLNYIADLTERQIQAAKRTGRYRRGAGLFGSVLPSTFLGSE